MKTLESRSNGLKRTFLSVTLIAVFSICARAGLYTYNFSDSGAIPQGNTTFSAEQTVSGIPTSISSVELVLTFNDSVDLTGGSGGIQGTIILNPTGSDTYVSFSPVQTSSGTGSQVIYDTGLLSSFNNQNPNDTWALNLWDNNTSGIENGLVSWTLEVNAVPEPVNVALGVFAGLAVLWWALGLCWKKPRDKQQRRRNRKAWGSLIRT